MAVTINEGTTFLISDDLGDVPEEGAFGLFSEDTRFLCLYRLLLDGQPPVPLSAQSVDYFAAEHFLTNPNLTRVPANIAAACSSASAPCSCCCSRAARPARPLTHRPARARLHSPPGAARRRRHDVAVVAHAAKTARTGAARAAARARRRGRHRPALVRGGEGQAGAGAGAPRARGGRGPVFAWGGDGTVRRCVAELAGEHRRLAIVPGGTANLLAANHGIPADIERAVAIGLRGERRRSTSAASHGERFAVMAGVGFDASMIRDADAAQGAASAGRPMSGAARATCARRRSRPRSRSTAPWFDGRATCSSSATSVTCSAASSCFRTLAPTTGSSTSASSRPRASPVGAHARAHRDRRSRAARRSCARPGRAR